MDIGDATREPGDDLAWCEKLAGGNPGIKASRADVEHALHELDAVCDEAAAPVGQTKDDEHD